MPATFYIGDGNVHIPNIYIKDMWNHSSQQAFDCKEFAKRLEAYVRNNTGPQQGNIGDPTKLNWENNTITTIKLFYSRTKNDASTKVSVINDIEEFEMYCRATRATIYLYL